MILRGLIYHDIDAPKTHDLVMLYKLCSAVDSEYEQIANAYLELTPYGVQARYPSNQELDELDIACALAECHKIEQFVQGQLVFD